jgi:O-antigen/teichoic acid export membrane protein
VVVAALILQLTFWTGPALLSVGRPALRTLMMLVSSVVYVALLLLLVPKFSYLGAAFAYLGYAVVRPLISIIALKASISIEKERLSKLKATEPPI